MLEKQSAAAEKRDPNARVAIQSGENEWGRGGVVVRGMCVCMFDGKTGGWNVKADGEALLGLVLKPEVDGKIKS